MKLKYFPQTMRTQAINLALIVNLLFLPGLFQSAESAESVPLIALPTTSLKPVNVAIIVNDRDPLSVQIGNYYQHRRKIPEANVLHVRFDPNKHVLTQKEFGLIKIWLDKKTPANVQAYALTWANTYRVGCMSITSAVSLGFDEKYCAKGCKPTAPNPYFDSNSENPLIDFGFRPSMMLAAKDLSSAIKLIDRGIASDQSMPVGTAYLVTTKDNRRNVRKAFYPEIKRVFKTKTNIIDLKAAGIENKDDVLFYFTGAKHVPGIETNDYLPGAVADHLTSSGGQLTNSRQMSSLKWLEAGATGSYGTAVEPCNFLQKFSNPGVLMKHYLNGATLIEAYWKSVAQPGQGVFIGEPLAQPFGGYRLRRVAGSWKLEAPALQDGYYRLQVSNSAKGPWRTINERFLISRNSGWLTNQGFRFYRIASTVN